MYMLKLRTQMSSFKIEATGILNNARKIQKSITKAESRTTSPNRCPDQSRKSGCSLTII